MTISIRPLLTIALLGCLIQACVTTSPTELEQSRVLIGSDWPARADSLVTTSGDIYVGNLNSQIMSLKQQLLRRSNDELLALLARSLYHRFQIIGRLEDAEQARSLLAAAHERTHSPVIDVAYAEVLSGFHEFRLALEVLETAGANGAEQGLLAQTRLAIERATGQLSAESMVAQLAVDSSSPVAMIMQAGELVERGQIVAASRLLKQAQDNYLSSSPYLLAWLHVEQGIVFLRYRDYRSARIFFAAAHERFPQYTPAKEHLAETELALENYRPAATHYGDVAAKTGNPEFYHQLAVAERALGDKHAARLHEQRARDAYKALLARYPSMYADHAARFYMDVGDTKAALDLAQMNFAFRQDIRARVLLLETQLHAEDIDAACSVYRDIQQLGYAPPELAVMAVPMHMQCDA